MNLTFSDEVSVGIADPKDNLPSLETINTAALVAEVEEIVKKVNKPPIAPEDEFIPPGRRKWDRESLTEWKQELTKEGPPVLHNKDVCRQNYALRDFAYTLTNTITMNDINSKDTAANMLKPAIANSFYIKERSWLDPEYVGPEHESRQY